MKFDLLTLSPCNDKTQIFFKVFFMYLWLNLKKSTFVYLMVDQVTSKIELTDALSLFVFDKLFNSSCFDTQSPLSQINENEKPIMFTKSLVIGKSYINNTIFSYRIFVTFLKASYTKNMHSWSGTHYMAIKSNTGEKKNQ